MARVINRAGMDLIKQYEGCRLKAYKCPAGVWTIGYGHTGPDVRPGLVISQAEADHLLLGDLLRFEHAVELATVPERTSDNQFAALVSLIYNVGPGWIPKASVFRLHKSGQFGAAGNAFLRFSRAAGRVLPGLVRRRTAERALYLSK